MKRFIGVILCLLLTIGCFAVADKGEQTEKTTQDILETEKIKYLTDEDFARLYTCRDDVRIKDDTIVELSLSDAILLMQVARSEGGDSCLGQIWVMRTILNRLDAGWANSLWDVLTMEDQFTVVTNGTYKNADVNVSSHIALALIEQGWNETQGALYWESNSNSPDSWHKKNLTFIKEVEGNLFYK